jgi:hypothetical protein
MDTSFSKRVFIKLDFPAFRKPTTTIDEDSERGLCRVEGVAKKSVLCRVGAVIKGSGFCRVED